MPTDSIFVLIMIQLIDICVTLDLFSLEDFRDAPGYHFVCFFEHCSKGEGGGSNPCSKNFVANLV